MSLGNRIIDLRKQRKWSRDELGKIIGTSGAMIGKYERNEMNPSVEIAKKIAEALEVSLDYLVGSTSFVVKDKQMLKRLQDINNLPDKEKDCLITTIDHFIKASKINQM